MGKRSQLFLLPLQQQSRPRAWVTGLCLLVSLYAPFGWLVIFEGPWDQRRWSWIQSWPLLPGLVLQSLQPVAGASPEISYSLMGGLTFGIFLLLFRIGRASVWSLLSACLIGAGFASLNSWLAFQAYPTAY